jgi:flagellar biosynthesis protein
VVDPVIEHPPIAGHRNRPRGLYEAVALEYGLNQAPVLTTRAQGEAALRVVEQARRHGIHIVQDARLLAQLSRVGLDEQIPPELYRAVGVLLSWSYWLRGMVPGDEKRR